MSIRLKNIAMIKTSGTKEWSTYLNFDDQLHQLLKTYNNHERYYFSPINGFTINKLIK